MNFWETYEKLCLNVGKKPTQAGRELSISPASITQWKNGSIPSGEKLIQIADYFEVSIDYLLGRVDEPTPTTQSSQGHTNGDNSTQEIQHSPISTYQANFGTDSASQTSQGHTNGNNSTQKIDHSPVNTFQVNLPQSDNVTIEFFKAFEELDFFDKVEVMHFALQKVKNTPKGA